MFGRKPYNYESFSNHELLRHAARHGFGTGPEPGETAPEFELRTLKGKPVRLSEFHGKKNVVLTFGSATCPFTASSIRLLGDLHDDYSDNSDVEFLFVYIREAHPGEKLPAHSTIADKLRAARVFQKEEKVNFPVLVDDLKGHVHRKYGKMPNPTYIIDKSGRIAFRSLWSRISSIEDALESLIETQKQHRTDHAIVNGGEDLSVPMKYAILSSPRALKRGGKRAIREFREGLGRPGRIAHTTAKVVGPIVMNPGRAVTAAGLAAGVIAGGLYVGHRLRQARFANYNPYKYSAQTERNNSDYAVGI